MKLLLLLIFNACPNRITRILMCEVVCLKFGGQESLGLNLCHNCPVKRPCPGTLREGKAWTWLHAAATLQKGRQNWWQDISCGFYFQLPLGHKQLRVRCMIWIAICLPSATRWRSCVSRRELENNSFNQKIHGCSICIDLYPFLCGLFWKTPPSSPSWVFLLTVSWEATLRWISFIEPQSLGLCRFELWRQPGIRTFRSPWSPLALAVLRNMKSGVRWWYFFGGLASNISEGCWGKKGPVDTCWNMGLFSAWDQARHQAHGLLEQRIAEIDAGVKEP